MGTFGRGRGILIGLIGLWAAWTNLGDDINSNDKSLSMMGSRFPSRPSRPLR